MLRLDIAFSRASSLLSLFNSFSSFSFASELKDLSGHKHWEGTLNAIVHEMLKCEPVPKTGKRYGLQEKGRKGE